MFFFVLLINSRNGTEEQTAHHTIRVYGDSLRNIAEKTLEKGKLVRLMGSLHYDKCNTQDQRTANSVSVIVTNILKPIAMNTKIDEMAADSDA